MPWEFAGSFSSSKLDTQIYFPSETVSSTATTYRIDTPSPRNMEPERVDDDVTMQPDNQMGLSDEDATPRGADLQNATKGPKRMRATEALVVEKQSNDEAPAWAKMMFGGLHAQIDTKLEPVAKMAEDMKHLRAGMQEMRGEIVGIKADLNNHSSRLDQLEKELASLRAGGQASTVSSNASSSTHSGIYYGLKIEPKIIICNICPYEKVRDEGWTRADLERLLDKLDAADKGKVRITPMRFKRCRIFELLLPTDIEAMEVAEKLEKHLSEDSRYHQEMKLFAATCVSQKRRHLVNGAKNFIQAMLLPGKEMECTGAPHWHVQQKGTTIPMASIDGKSCTIRFAETTLQSLKMSAVEAQQNFRSYVQGFLIEDESFSPMDTQDPVSYFSSSSLHVHARHDYHPGPQHELLGAINQGESLLIYPYISSCMRRSMSHFTVFAGLFFDVIVCIPSFLMLIGLILVKINHGIFKAIVIQRRKRERERAKREREEREQRGRELTRQRNRMGRPPTEQTGG